MSNSIVATGSLTDQMQLGEAANLAEAFLNVKLILLCDRSGSMYIPDAFEGKRRYEVEDGIVRRLQSEHPCQVLLASFTSGAKLHPNGILPKPNGGTQMLDGLKLIRDFCISDVKCCLVSDGEPEETEESIMAFVKQHFAGRLDTAFAGPEGSRGAELMRRIAEAAGGKWSVDALTKPAELTAKLNNMLGAGA